LYRKDSIGEYVISVNRSWEILGEMQFSKEVKDKMKKFMKL